jgi:hypothetical protein
MIKDLTKLANYLDDKELLREANIVDIFINRIAQVDFKSNPNMAEPTWEDDGDTFDNIPNLNQKNDESFDVFEKGMPKVKLHNGVQVDLENHPLGKKILDYIKHTFHIADSGTETEQSKGLISVKDIDSIISTSFRYDDQFKNIGKGKNNNPISPALMRDLLQESMRAYNHIFEPVGFLDGSEVRSSVHNLYKHYEDSYVEQYLGEEFSKVYTTDGDAPQYIPSEKDLSPEQKRQLWERNEVDKLPTIDKTIKNQTSEQIQKELKKEFPGSWHKVLFDK